MIPTCPNFMQEFSVPSTWGADPLSLSTRGCHYLTAIHKLDHDQEQVCAMAYPSRAKGARDIDIDVIDRRQQRVSTRSMKWGNESISTNERRLAVPRDLQPAPRTDWYTRHGRRLVVLIEKIDRERLHVVLPCGESRLLDPTMEVLQRSAPNHMLLPTSGQTLDDVSGSLTPS